MQYISIDIPKQFRNPEIHLQLRGSTSYMCGILCLVSSGTYSVPPCFSDVVSKRDLWSTSDPKIIESFVKKDRQHTVLTLQDSRKLAGLDSLRTLNLELIKLNNNVKIRDDEAINAVQEQIDAIIGNESQEESHYYLTEEVFEALVYKIASRGPDYLGYIRPNENLQLFSSVLSLRQPFQLQPEEEDGFFSSLMENCIMRNVSTVTILDISWNSLRSHALPIQRPSPETTRYFESCVC